MLLPDRARVHDCRVFPPRTADSLGYGGLTAMVQAVHFPVHRGLRFSRNELTPSRKSAVVRMRAFSSTAAAICRSSSSEEICFSRRLVASNEAGLFCNRLAANSRARSSSLSGCNHLVGQPQAKGFVGADDPPREQQIARLLLADLAQQERRDNRGNESDAHLGISELGFAWRPR